ncbi:MAG: Sensory transduction protein regX3 [Firmicutes bacterium ADurb.Bin182]|nr:MAG: Sensory transduction protein regX3 [Firmicutes bacterium ADurb.Bin182]
MSAKKSVLIVDDEKKIAEVMRSYFENAGYDVEIAHSGTEAINAFEHRTPSLIVLDLMMPGMSGEEVCKTIRKRSCVPIIMLTAKSEEESVLQGFGIGADDYVPKPFSPRQLLARADAVLRRASADAVPVADEISYNDGELVLDNLRHEVRKNGVNVRLTPKEYNILMTMARYPTKAFTRDELIDFALGSEFAGFDRVIDTHVKNIRQKIETDPKSPKYIITVHGLGYRFGGDIL